MAPLYHVFCQLLDKICLRGNKKAARLPLFLCLIFYLDWFFKIVEVVADLPLALAVWIRAHEALVNWFGQGGLAMGTGKEGSRNGRFPHMRMRHSNKHAGA
jgi:hypothetical protein